MNNFKLLLRIGILSALYMGVSSYLFELSLLNIIINIGIVMAMVPLITRFIVKTQDEKNRFYEAVTYLEQMIYSFLKFPKIREALLDVSEISKGRLKNTIESALNCIDDGNDINIFQKALKKMEHIYNCRHIICLHKYLVKLETEGGEYEVFLNMMLKDVKSWSNTVIEFRMDVEKKKRNVLFAIAVTVITGGLMVRLVPDEFSFIGILAYKIIISVCLSLLYLIYVYIQMKSSKSWLESYKEIPEKLARKYDDIVYNGVPKKEKIICSALALIVSLVAFISIYVFNNKFIMFIFVAFAGICLLRNKFRYGKIKRRMSDEFQKCFSDWLLNFGMNLQNETVQTSLYHSYKNAPGVMRPELERVLKLMLSHPVSIKPYDSFLEKYDLGEIKSSFRMLYPMQTLEHEQVLKHLELIVERSQRITSKSFILQQEDKLGMINMLVTAPQLVGIIMIMTSIFLLVTNFSNVINNSMSGLSGIL